MALRELLLKLGVDVDRQGIKEADNALNGLKRAAGVVLGGFAAFQSVKLFTGEFDKIRAMADELDEASTRVGVSTDALQELRFASKLAGVEAEALTTTIGKLQKNAVEAGDGSKSMAKDFARLGVNVKDASGNVKSGDQLLMEVADGLANVEGDSERAALAMSIMGRSGAALLPLMKDGAAGIQKMRQEARDLGGVMDKETINEFAKLSDEQDRLNLTMMGLKVTIAKEIMPWVMRMTGAAIAFAKGLRGPLMAAMQSVQRIFKVIARPIIFLNKKFEEMTGGIGLLPAILVTVGAAMIGFTAISVAGAIASGAAWLIANLPLIALAVLLGLLGAAIYLIIDDFEVWKAGGESLFGSLYEMFFSLDGSVRSFGELVKSVLETFAESIGFSIDSAQDFANQWLAIGTIIKDVVVWAIERLASSLAVLWTFVTDVFSIGIIDAFFRLGDNLRMVFQETIDDLVALFTEGLDTISNAIVETIGLGDLKLQGNDLKKARARRSEILGNMSGAGNVGGVSGTAALGGRPGSTTNNSMVNQPSVKVEVDARGATNPKAVGDAVGGAVASASGMRRAKQKFAVSKP